MAENTPDDFPPLTLPIMRALCALVVLYPGQEGQEKLIKALDVLYPEYWVEHKKTKEKDVLAGILERVLGKDDCAKGEKIPSLFVVG